MQYQYEQFETILAEERERLVRLCAWFSRNPDSAEDLAQETLIAAWKNKAQLTSLDKLKPWTAAIARNVCLHWSRGYHREQSRIAYSIDTESEPFGDEIRDDTNIELELDRSELARLLDQALALLPEETARMLVEHYLQDSSHAEIAEKMRVNPGTVAVRLQRGKLTLQKLLRKQLQAETSAFGFVHPNPRWEQTNIWCPWCGQARLLGKYQKDEVFALRCPECDPDSESFMAGLDLTKPCHTRLLGDVKTYKPAYARLLTAFLPLYQQALKTHNAPCLACGAQVDVLLKDDKQTKKHPREFTQITLHCPACGWASNKSSMGLVMASAEAQRFWRDHPRMRTLPPQEIEVNGSAAFLTKLQSVTDSAELTMISRRDTYELMEVHTNVTL